MSDPGSFTSDYTSSDEDETPLTGLGPNAGVRDYQLVCSATSQILLFIDYCFVFRLLRKVNNS